MGWLKNIFRGRRAEEDVLQLSRRLNALVEQTAQEVFERHRETLLGQRPGYIAPAVWGAVGEGRLTEEQRRIHARLKPVIDSIIDQLVAAGHTRSQVFALGFIVRDLMVSKITYRIYMMKGYLAEHLNDINRDEHNLSDLEPVGSA